MNERCCIVEYLNLGWSLSKIAKELNRNKSSISRKIRRNNLSGKYSAHIAQDKYEIRRIKCKPYGKMANVSLVNYVQEKLNAHWSPEQISGRIKLKLNEQIISFRTIYSWLYKAILEHCSVKLLRRKGKSLKPKETRGRFNIGKIISQRPKEARKRLEIGHWELDTVVSSRGKSKACLSTFVERKTRITKIRIMPNRKASTFNEHCIIALSNFDNNKLKSLTVDRGKEFAGYLELENKLDLDVYFADSYSSWQRGTNENTNGLIREFFPKKFDFSTINQHDVDIVEGILNNRPRKCLGYKTPIEGFNEEQAKVALSLKIHHINKLEGVIRMR
ncbi:IS30 family transposase [Clostridium sp. ZBS13]|uniref:IS30 family transposase n=1 Tax=Clostridium sp. ZBS13 TaxID=2949971 RepID=UPI00338DD7D5